MSLCFRHAAFSMTMEELKNAFTRITGTLPPVLWGVPNVSDDGDYLCAIMEAMEYRKKYGDPILLESTKSVVIHCGYTNAEGQYFHFAW